MGGMMILGVAMMITMMNGDLGMMSGHDRRSDSARAEQHGDGTVNADEGGSRREMMEAQRTDAPRAARSMSLGEHPAGSHAGH